MTLTCPYWRGYTEFCVLVLLQDPYCIVKCGTQSFRSRTHKVRGGDRGGEQAIMGWCSTACIPT